MIYNYLYKQISSWLGRERGLTEKGQEGTFGDEGNILYLDYSGNYRSVHICHTQQMVHLK